jgi:ATP-binding cassette subfamily B protein
METDSTTEPDPLEYDVPPEERSEKLWGYFLRYKWYFLLGAGFLILTNLQKLTIPVYIGHAVQMMRDAAGSSEMSLAAVRSDLVNAGLIIIALAIGAAIARILSRITIFNPGRYIEFDIRNELYRKLTDLTPAFFDPAPTGDVTSRVTNDVKRVRVFYALTFLHVVNTGVAYAIGIWRMASVDWTLTLICLAPYPFLLAAILWVGQVLFYKEKVVQSQLSDISSKVQENLGGMSVVKSYTMENREIGHFEDLNEDFFTKNMDLAVAKGGLNSLVLLISGVGTVMLLIAGTGRVVEGTLTLGEFVELNGYVVQLAFPTIAMGWVFSIWHRGRAAFDRIIQILAREPELDDPPEDEQMEMPPLEAGIPRGRIEFDGVNFSYPDGEQVLHDIDLDIPAGSTVAFVGKTGSGKSTLVRLMTRLYDPDSGEVRIDDTPVDRLNLRELRGEIGFVPQDPLLYSMTLRQNIRFGLDALEYDPSISRKLPTGSLKPDVEPEGLTQEDRIEQAVDVAGLRPDVESFAEGLDTVVGERGVTLSGGQKQRVTLARALLVDPRILILDDALSSVDTKTEQVILDHLEHLMADRTSVLLTHRFNALDRVDQIYVLQEGRIVEQGTHRELCDRGGVYADMYHRQQVEKDLES